MKEIVSLNKSLPKQESLDDAIKELLSREELICTGHACGADAGLI